MKGEGEQQGASVWRFARASRAHVVIDAAGYFNLLHEAMLAARERIMLLGWDFDTRVRLGSGRRWWNLPRRAQYPERLGGLVVWLVRRRRTLRTPLPPRRPRPLWPPRRSTATAPSPSTSGAL